MITKKGDKRFELQITLDENGRPQTSTRNQGLPYEVIVGALSQQLHIYNTLWAKKASTTFEEK